MLKRKITDDLMRWKNGPRKKSLLVRGARQVGKTFSINEFGKNNYGAYIYINFEENPSYKDIFAGDRDVDTIMRKMSMAFKDKEFIPGDTLIFLDEIQNCPDARVAFKFFTQDGRYDVIGSGSLLGVLYKEVSSYPVGYEDVIDMRSLDFEEFLWAMGVGDDSIAYVRECISRKEAIDDFTLGEFEKYLKQYMLVGGMPEAVSVFRGTGHYGQAQTVMKGILGGYMDDVSKYAVGLDKNRVRATFLSIPAQLSKRNKKFTYVDIEGRKGNGRNVYGDGLSWLYDAGVIDFCHNLQKPALPLAGNKRLNAFKVYMKDTGLLVSMMEDDLSFALRDDGIYVNKGAIAENLVAEMISKNGHPLTYFERRGTLEVDFILNLKGAVTAVEAKSGGNKQSKSLDVVMSDKYGVDRGIKLERGNIHVDGKGVEHYPIFAAAFLESM
ncbi:MAG: ATP-binding protein [Thermoplasmatales archaeon]|nr:ATP-binding protein [Thermoplasmatales archaeon]